MSKIKLKRFSKDEITEKDYFEFNMWIKSKTDRRPRLLVEKFNGDNAAYEEYMMEKQREFSNGDCMNGGLAFSLESSVCLDDRRGLATLIGDLLMSVTVTHMFHLCTRSYAAHIALQGYYEEMPDLVDELAEAYVALSDRVEFNVSTLEFGRCPVAYLTALSDAVASAKADPQCAAGVYQSTLDSIQELITSTLYKLTHLE